MNSFSSVLSLSNPSQYESKPIEAAGNCAEEELKKQLETLKSFKVFQSVRLKNVVEQNEIFEIDLVGLSANQLFIVEVKNWSGKVQENYDGSWTQLRRNGTYITHENVVRKTEKKALSLQNYLIRCGVDSLDELGAVQWYVVFANPNLVLSTAISNYPQVFERKDFLSSLEGGTKSIATKIWELIKFVVVGQKFSPGDLKLMNEILYTMPSWDKIFLTGGRVLSGHLECCSDKELNSLLSKEKRLEIEDIEFHHSRNIIVNVIKWAIGSQVIKAVLKERRDQTAWNSWFPLTQNIHVDCHSTILFRCAGTRDVTKMKVNEILRICLAPS